MYLISFLFVIGCNDWVFVWLGLEINMLSFLVIMINKTSVEVEVCIKYFLIQGVGSALLLMMFFMSMKGLLMSIFLVMVLMYKIGGGMFYFWFPCVCEGISWFSMFMLMSFQKVLPLFIMSMFVNYMLWLNSIISLVVGVMGSFNQIKMKRLMAYSSIHHLGWIFLGIYLEITMWLSYLIMYFFLLLSVIYVLINYNVVNMFLNKYVSVKVSMVVAFLSMGGMPPLLGFYLKWMIMYYLVSEDFVMIIFMILMSVVMLYIYLRVIYGVVMGVTMKKNYLMEFSNLTSGYDMFVILGMLLGGLLFLWIL